MPIIKARNSTGNIILSNITLCLSQDLQEMNLIWIINIGPQNLIQPNSSRAFLRGIQSLESENI